MKKSRKLGVAAGAGTAFAAACLVTAMVYFAAEQRGATSLPVRQPPAHTAAHPQVRANSSPAATDADQTAGAVTAGPRVGENVPAPPAPEVLRALVEFERSADPRMREQAVFALAEAGTEAALSAIERALLDEDASVRTAAIDVLADIGSERAAHALVHAWFSQGEELREEIVHVLAESGGAPGREILLTAAYDESPAVREAALAYQAIP